MLQTINQLVHTYELPLIYVVIAVGFILLMIGNVFVAKKNKLVEAKACQKEIKQVNITAVVLHAVSYVFMIGGVILLIAGGHFSAALGSFFG